MLSWLQGQVSLGGLSDADLSAQHLQLQGDLKKLRIGIPIVVLVVIVGFALNIKSTVQSVSGDAVAAAFEKRASRLVPKVQEAFMQVGKNVTPAISDMMQKEVDNLIAKFSGNLNKEMTTLKDTLPKQLEGQVMRQMKEANERQVASLQEAFPELKADPKKLGQLMDALQGGFTKWASTTLVTRFNKHLIELENIKNTLNGFVAAQHKAAADAKGEAAKIAGGKGVKADNRIHPEQLLSLWLELVNTSIEGEAGPTDLLEGEKKDKKKAK